MSRRATALRTRRRTADDRAARRGDRDVGAQHPRPPGPRPARRRPRSGCGSATTGPSTSPSCRRSASSRTRASTSPGSSGCSRTRDGTAERLLEFKQALAAPRSDEAPPRRHARWSSAAGFEVDAAERRRRARPGRSSSACSSRSAAAATRRRARRCSRSATRSWHRGISLDSALSVLEDIERHSDSVSRSFVKLFLAEVWKPFAQADMPAERWPEIEAAIAAPAPDRLRGADGYLPAERMSARSRAPSARSPGAYRNGPGKRMTEQTDPERPYPRARCSTAGSSAAAGWGRHAEHIREFGHAGLAPG